MLFITGYIVFFFALLLAKHRRSNRIIDRNGIVANQAILLALHTIGILLFGIVPIFFSDKSPLQILFGKNQPSDLSIITVAILIIGTFAIVPRIADKDSLRLQILSRTLSLTPAFLTNYFILRVVFLCAYELSFRGYFLDDCVINFGWQVATLLNLASYAFIHVVNGKGEMKGCIPLGLIFCSLCIWTQAAWPAIVLHIAITLAYESKLINRINHSTIAIV